jgi:hypothetical protein
VRQKNNKENDEYKERWEYSTILSHSSEKKKKEKRKSVEIGEAFCFQSVS